MRTGNKDDYLGKLTKIVNARNEEIAQQLSNERNPSRGHQQEGVATRSATEPANALSIILLNLENMEGYYTWSKTQAIIIFCVAIAACIFGIVMIALAFVYSVTGKVALDKTILTTIGGVVTELFAGTTLIVYKSSLKQLNYYHKSLHEDQRFLSSVDLLCRFSNEKNRDKMLQTIICSSMQISIAAATEGDDAAESEQAK
ncbi:MAG: hypothetical protein VB061_02580 [Christensenella sp.]|nr:hypothetical protein [Christensenella sp.]